LRGRKNQERKRKPSGSRGRVRSRDKESRQTREKGKGSGVKTRRKVTKDCLACRNGFDDKEQGQQTPGLDAAGGFGRANVGVIKRQHRNEKKEGRKLSRD